MAAIASLTREEALQIVEWYYSLDRPCNSTAEDDKNDHGGNARAPNAVIGALTREEELQLLEWYYGLDRPCNSTAEDDKNDSGRHVRGSDAGLYIGCRGMAGGSFAAALSNAKRRN